MDALLEFLYRPTSVGHLLYFDFVFYLVGGAFLVLGAASAVAIWRRNRPAEHDANYRSVQCATCGWQGMVSKYVRTCPKCRDSNFVSQT
jgi:hypothetical protein